MSYRASIELSRRELLKAIAGGALVVATPQLAGAHDLPHLSDANPGAASLGYTENTDTIDPRRFPKHTAQQRCANCKYFQVGAGVPYAPCRLYPGNTVHVNGWCAGYLARS